MEDRKRHNRKLKRLLVAGKISQEQAAPLFRKNKGGKMKEEEKNEPAVQGALDTIQEGEGASGAGSGKGRAERGSSSSMQGAFRTEEEENKTSGPAEIKHFKGEGKGGSLGVAVIDEGTAKEHPPNSSPTPIKNYKRGCGRDVGYRIFQNA